MKTIQIRASDAEYLELQAIASATGQTASSIVRAVMESNWATFRADAIAHVRRQQERPYAAPFARQADVPEERTVMGDGDLDARHARVLFDKAVSDIGEAFRKDERVSISAADVFGAKGRAVYVLLAHIWEDDTAGKTDLWALIAKRWAKELAAANKSSGGAKDVPKFGDKIDRTTPNSRRREAADQFRVAPGPNAGGPGATRTPHTSCTSTAVRTASRFSQTHRTNTRTTRYVTNGFPPDCRRVTIS